MNSHNQVEIVAPLERRVDQCHTARGAHGVRIGRLAAINLCDHDRIAVRTPRKTSTIVLVPAIGRHT